MTQGSRAREIASYSFLKVFADDGVIDAAELRFIEKLALLDGYVDDAERTVLDNIFARVTEDELEPDVRDEIARFRAEYGF